MNNISTIRWMWITNACYTRHTGWTVKLTGVADLVLRFTAYMCLFHAASAAFHGSTGCGQLRYEVRLIFITFFRPNERINAEWPSTHTFNEKCRLYEIRNSRLAKLSVTWSMYGSSQFSEHFLMFPKCSRAAGKWKKKWFYFVEDTFLSHLFANNYNEIKRKD